MNQWPTTALTVHLQYSCLFTPHHNPRPHPSPVCKRYSETKSDSILRHRRSTFVCREHLCRRHHLCNPVHSHAMKDQKKCVFKAASCTYPGCLPAPFSPMRTKQRCNPSLRHACVPKPSPRFTSHPLASSFFSLFEQQQLVDKCIDIGRQDGGFFDCHNEKTKHMKVCSE